MHEICHDSIAIYDLCTHQLLGEQLAEFPAILDSFFTGIANTSCTPTGWEGGGWEGSHEVAGKGYVFTKTSQMASIGVIFTSRYHTKQLNPWLNSSASHVVNYSQLSACQGDMQPFEGNPYTHGHLSDKPQKQATAKVA